MKQEVISEKEGFIKKNRYGWDICDDDFWGTGYSHDMNDAWLYHDSGIPAKETITKVSFEGHIIKTYMTKNGKYGAKCDNCGSTHHGKPKEELITAYQSLVSKECAYTVRKITLI